ncbi:hypothetical protein DRQ36_05090 [bacterium]|nr:MAG: hypothetical protein DRQ36_05090 [bacterium]
MATGKDNIISEKERQLIALFDTVARITTAETLTDQLNEVAEGVRAAGLYRRAIITIFGAEYERIGVGYAGLTDEDIIIHKSKPPTPKELWREVFTEKYRVGSSYYIPHGDPLNIMMSGVESHTPEKSFVGWHPSDMLFIPLISFDGEIIGVMSVDDPFDRCRPTAESLRVPELFAREAAILIERSRISRELSKTKQYLENLIETSADLIVTTDTAGKIVIFNKAAERILEYSASEIVGQPVTMIYADEAEARKIMRLMREGTGRVESLEVIAKAKSGEEFPISLSVAILYDDKGNEIGTIGTSEDLRPIKELQEKTAELKRKEDIRAVVVTLSHNINTYLQALTTGGQNLEELFQSDDIVINNKEILERAENYMTTIKLNAVRIRELTKGLRNPPDDLIIDEYLEGIKMLRLQDDLEVNIEAHDHEAMSFPDEEHLVLVADDDSSIREGIADFLRAHGFAVDTASDGSEAIELIEKKAKRYDAIISDIKMPGANGYEVFMAAREADPELEIILMTAFGYEPGHIRVEVSKKGHKKWVFKEKPFDMNNILNMLTEIIEQKYG